MQPHLTFLPSIEGSGNIPLGQAEAGGTITVPFTLKFFCGPHTDIINGLIEVTSIVSSDPNFALAFIAPGGYPSAFLNGDTATFNVVVSKAVAGFYQATLSITWNVNTETSSSVTLVLPLTANFTVAGANLSFSPPMAVFAEQDFNSGNNMLVGIKNNTGSPVTINSMGPGPGAGSAEFSISTAFPLTIAAGATSFVNVECAFTELGIITNLFAINTSLGVAEVFAASASTVNVMPVQIVNGVPLIMLFLDGKTTAGVQAMDSTNFNSERDCVLIFNGAVYKNPGYEKVLRRVELYYKDIGVCTSLTLTVKAWRPQLNPPLGGYDTQSDTISIGSVVAGGKELSAYFDVNLSGELIVMSLTRAANSGPCSIIGFMPQFEDAGEKVEGV